MEGAYMRMMVCPAASVPTLKPEKPKKGELEATTAD
jgi:hypothetical protein